MKILSTAVKALIATDNIQHFHMLKIGPFKDENGNIVTWMHTPVIGGIILSDGSAYSDNNTLVHIDPPRQSAAVDREAFKISYADPTFSMRALFESGFTGAPVEIRLGFYNTLGIYCGGAISGLTYPQGVAPGMPLLDIQDTVIVYAGTSDTPVYTIDFKGEANVVIECTSPMGALGMTKTLVTNRETLRSQYPTDSAYDEIYSGSKGLTLLWGKTK